ncbi:Kinesin domain-containing protein [Cephalotus follicularis]|uniref:Kinesin domain-containing protein n=1 Tax=Cephalotus follicularis TaxID=3775 RepID=A0A1Q3ALW6_CEPFO|nr:Kinesin domain-containing protein [Cephalotus follicularis]
MKSPSTCPNTLTVRRNPHRKARPTPTTNAPPNSTLNSSPHIPYFPIEDILSIQIPQNPQPNTPSIKESLKVFLRIRPPVKTAINVSEQHQKSRAKNFWPQNPSKKPNPKDKILKKKPNTDLSITVNDSHSVTLSPPLSLQESKRIKSEIYEGFSHVFSIDSSQVEVYETMVNPLVEDFLGGKSGMLAALGPTGSGKTHTVFGSPRNPGMVPLALRRLFKRTGSCGEESSRSFYISMFEICSERGKGERLIDLSPDGADICLQQSTIKGLLEVFISDAAQAESLIARALLKRATAMTNANSQSSRSQCIINIRSAAERLDGEQVDVQANSAVLTIVDLAGAEREKRTGNQGARLLESNFINNTSMVFGLCLRSLLERQKNPKKPLQKNFQNSLLTRYLRDYLEGKKRMALILTVKSGEEDYLDTSYLLRQASPYMKIKFDNVEEPSNYVSNKRHFQTLSRIEQPKRMKLSSIDPSAIEEGKSSSDEHQLPKEEIQKIHKLDDNVDLTKRERNNQIMQNFAKALWNVLKEYNEKLKLAESEMRSLRQNLNDEKTRYCELEKELKDLKSCCTCYQERLVQDNVDEVDTSLESRVKLEGQECTSVDKINVDIHSSNFKASENIITLDQFDPPSGKLEDVIPQVKCSDGDAINASCIGDANEKNYEGGFEFNTAVTQHVDQTCENFSANGNCAEDLSVMTLSEVKNNHPNADMEGDFLVCSPHPLAVVRSDSISSAKLVLEQRGEDEVKGSDVDVVKASCIGDANERNYEDGFEFNTAAAKLVDQTCKNFSANGNCAGDLSVIPLSEVKNTHPNADMEGGSSDFLVSSPQPLAVIMSDSHCSAKLVLEQSGEDEGTLEPLVLPKEVISMHDDVTHSEPTLGTSLKHVNEEKPKRRLMPASTILLRDISVLEIEDELERPKVNKGGKKLSADTRKITQGGLSLLRLLKENNLRH